MSIVDLPRKATLPPLVAGQRLDRATYHERYEAMPPTTHAELIGGVVYMPSPLSRDHAEENIPPVVWLDYYAEHTPGVRGGINASIFLGDFGEPQPDCGLRILPTHGGRTRHEGEYLAEAPELIVEIAKSSRRIDLGPKKADYERAGCPEYVVVALDPQQVHWFILRDGRFAPLATGPDGISRSEVFPGLWLDPAAPFSGDRRRLREVVDLGVATPEHAAFVARLAAAAGA